VAVTWDVLVEPVAVVPGAVVWTVGPATAGKDKMVNIFS